MQKPDTKPGPYYVSVRRENGDYRFLAGPYDTHQAALDDVPKVSELAYKYDPRGVWYSYGTCRITDGSYTEPGIFNAKGLI